ncbi:origin recognition complex subunit 2 [Odontomachus brunneus]|uniref:origin recognition complex subunit 2 n=1 Tax=Odontomachus brunneus TaxID=486640 RepID=UPI0013F265DD|nr:origin recognition complex subunit 2 [Odontomachus brunneus]XP_032663129.1 origin recognition complex subunit 2 [Odontomachus brunneus]
MSTNTLRRSSRIKSVVKYKNDSDTETSNSVLDNTLEAEIEEELKDIQEETQKPLELFSEKDVSGRKLYGFQTPVKKNSMMLKANQCRTPTTPVHLKTMSELKVVLDKIVIDKKTKKIIIHKNAAAKVSRKRFLPSVNSSGNESVSEDSEYIPTDDEANSESDEISNSSRESESFDTSEEEGNIMKERIEKKRGIVRNTLLKREVQNTPRQKTKNSRKTIVYKDCHIKTDEFFESQQEKTITSDRTLGRLRNTRLTEEKLGELLVNQNHVSTIHKKRIHSLIENYKSFFPMWHFIMEEGYSLLLHGLGSKRNLINDFHNEVLSDHPTLVINGFFPSLAIKDILNDIITEILDLDCPGSLNDCLELIEKVLAVNPNDRLYLLIHNIDGIMLRSNKAQNILASLAGIPNVRVLASVDHINAPLLWDHIKRAKFNFYWWDATTFLPYQAETSYESSLLVQQSGTLALSSLQNVFLSLTSNARAIYILLVKYQLNHIGGNYAGMLFKDLYQAAREQFLVSSDLALRAQLTEFIDHKLVRTKRNVDGAEYLTIPLDKGLLKQFLEQHDS